MGTKKTIWIIALLLCSIISHGQENFTLTVLVKNVEYEEGEIRIGLYNAEANWLEEAYREVAVNSTGAGELVSYSFTDLPGGTYAVAVLHDKNNNGKMDIGLTGPTESYGFSNEASGFLGAPDFSDAAFRLNADQTLTVKLR